MENRIGVVPLRRQRRPPETNTLAYRAHAHREVNARNTARHNVDSVASHIVEASQARGHSIRADRHIVQFITAIRIGGRGHLHPTAVRNDGYARKALRRDGCASGK